MKKSITIEEFVVELMQRIDAAQDIECCKEEIRNLAVLAKEHMPDKRIEVTWHEPGTTAHS